MIAAWSEIAVGILGVLSLAVLVAGSGAGNVMAQSYNQPMLEELMADCRYWAGRGQRGAEYLGESLIDLEDGQAVSMHRMRFDSERQIRALVSEPRAWRSRGRPGDLGIMDEACHMDRLEECLAAARGILMWGGKLIVISTHRGAASPFATLVRDIREGVAPGAVIRVTLKDAIAQGLYRRICAVTKRRWTAAGEAQWEADIRAEFGRNAPEELDCVPASGAGAWLPWADIRAAEDPRAGDAEAIGGGPIYFGIDVARRRDLWVLAVLERVGDVLWLRHIRAERDATFSEQRQIVRDLALRWRPAKIAIDQTGMGEAVVEQLADDHGASTVEGVLMTAPRKLAVATALREAVEDRRLRIPADDDLRRDLHSVRAEPGPTGAPRLAADRAATDGHADRFWAVALAASAAAAAGGEIDFAAAAPRPSAAALDAWPPPAGAHWAEGWT